MSPRKPAAKRTPPKKGRAGAKAKPRKPGKAPKPTAAAPVDTVAAIVSGDPPTERQLTRTQAALQAEAEARAQAEALALRIISRFETPEALEQAMGRLLEVFAAVALKIRTKQGGPLWPMALNPIQLDYLEGLRALFTAGKGDLFRGIRDLIVKPRQLGFSTFIAALYFMDGFLEPGRITVIVTHDDRISEELLRTYKLFFDELPDELREGVNLSKAAAKAYELQFDGLPERSRFEIRTEKGNPWRGGVIHNLHASEAAFYDDYPGFLNSYVQAVPATGNVIFETTTNGKNEFYEEVMRAEEGLSGYRVVFYPWYRHPEYRRPWDPARQPAPSTERPNKNELSEVEAMEAYGLDLEQLAWRRWKQGELKANFFQEYPETLLGAFLATSRSFFDSRAVERGHEAARIVSRQHPGRQPRAFVTIYEDPIPGETYVLSADVAEGLDRGERAGEKGGPDSSAAYMIHQRTLRVVAKVHGQIAPVEYGRILDRLGRLYNAVLVVERNNHGHTVLSVLEQADYPWLYRHVEYNQAGQRYLKAGFPTTPVTRPMLLDALDEVIRNGSLECRDERFWREADRFVRNPKTGKPEAMKNWHDDTIIGMGIGVYLCTLGRGAWGLDDPYGANAAGFPAPQDEAPAPRPPAPAPPPPPAVDTPAESAAARLRQVRAEVTAPAPVVAVVQPPVGLPVPQGGGILSTSPAGGTRFMDALAERVVRRSKVCGVCMHFQAHAPGDPAKAWCTLLKMKLQGEGDLGCNRWQELVEEDEEAILDSGLSGGETWK